MAKYRALSVDELKELEKEFVDFLVVNGITGDDWVKMKKEKPAEAQEMTEVFSEVVWTGILRNAKYLSHRTAHSVKCFHCQDEKIVLVGMDSETTDLTQIVFSELDKANFPDDISVYTTEKKYAKVREEEIYDMLGWGCQLDEGKWFKQICLVL